MRVHLIVPTARGRLAHRTALALQGALAHVADADSTVIMIRPGDAGLAALRELLSCSADSTPLLVVADKTYSDLVVKRNSRWRAVQPIAQLAFDRVGVWTTSAHGTATARDLAARAGGRICGDGSGGFDELFVRALAVSEGLPLTYVPLQGRGAAAIQTLEERAVAHVSSDSQEKEAFRAGLLRPLDVCPDARFGDMRHVPVSVFVGSGLSGGRMDVIERKLHDALETAAWVEFLAVEALVPQWRGRHDVESFLELSRANWLRAWCMVQDAAHAATNLATRGEQNDYCR